MKVWAGWLGLAMALSVALAGCHSSTTAVTLSISPTTTTVLLGTSVQFTPAEAGSENGIQWSVDGINNGNATVGTIDSTGLYTAPETLPVQPSAEVVPVLFAEPNAGIGGSDSTGSVIELPPGYDFTLFATGNTINITGNSVAAWNSSFVIQTSGLLSNGNFGIQIASPAGAPTLGTGGSATVTPGVTIGAQVELTSVAATATVTLDSGIRVSLSETSFTIGTNEQYLFATANAFGPTVTVTGTSNQTVTWSVSGVGTIDPASGLYTAPATAGTATVTATSVVDPTQSASASVNVIAAVDPTVTSISPPNGALGAAFQEVFITGTNFISTTNVYVNGSLLPGGALFSTTSTTLFVILPDSVLSSNFPVSGSTVPLTFTVGRQNGAQQSCSPSPCQVVLSPVRPALIASKPDSVKASGSSTAITLDGGYFGTTNNTLGFQGNPMVSVQFAGQPATFTYNSDRELLVTATPGTASVPGLYPITVTSTLSGSVNGSMAAANLAVEPTSTPSLTATATVGTSPSSVAINTATGVAIVANQGSNDITLLSVPAGGIVTQSLCTGALGSGSASSPGCVGSAPISVAVDNLRNFALVANSAVGNPTLAVVNLNLSPPQVTALLTFPSADSAGNPFNLIPRAVGINPVTGRALVDFTSSAATGSNVGAILDMNQIQNISGTLTLPGAGATPVLINVADISNGLNTHIAVSPRLNWALATPGGVGALSIVDLGRQTVNQIAGISCVPAATTPTVNVTTSTVNTLQVGQPVLVSGVAPATFDGIFSVTAVNNNSFEYYAEAPCPSGAPTGSAAIPGVAATATYALPVASVAVDLNVRSVSINDETEKALLVDPTSSEPAFIFDILDQASLSVNNLPTSTSNITGAINPLTNGALILNKGGQGYAIDPAVPTVTCSSQPCPSPPSATFSTGTTPVDVAIDPTTDTALIVNQGGTVSLYSLGALRAAPQILQTSVALPAAGSPTSSQVTLNSSLVSPATAADQTVTLIGNFDGSSVPQLDGNPSPFTSHSISANGRVMTATLSGATLAANGPRRYAVQAADSTTVASNAARLPVIQAVSLITGDCSAPAPQGVAINSGVTSLGQIYSAAIVTEPGCNDISMVSLSDSSGFTHGTGFGGAPELAVQSNPQGVDVYPPTGLAVVANAGSNSVSIIDMANDDVPVTFTTDPVPDGVAINLGTGNALVTANGASVVDTFPVSAASQTPSTIGVQQAPSGVAIDPLRGIAVVANSANGSNDASILNLSSSSTTFTTTAGSIVFPQGVAFDPISDTFMITSGSNNQVVLLNPVTDESSSIRVGIDPSSIAYNPVSGTLVTANNLSGTVTMVDFLDQTVRAVFSLNSSTQFAVAVQPQTNLAVIADAADNQLLLVPLPN